MRRVALIVALLAGASPAFGADAYCNGKDRLDFINTGVVRLTVNGVNSIWYDAGGLGTGIAGRLYENSETGETAGISIDDTPGAANEQFFVKNSVETVYRGCADAKP
jgi:hypothetical protein